MVNPDNSILKAEEFIDDAQEIIARTNDLMAALNKLIAKDYAGKELDPKQLARQARLDEDLAALVQRHFPRPSDASGQAVAENNSASSANNAAVRPGRFRPRI